VFWAELGSFGQDAWYMTSPCAKMQLERHFDASTIRSTLAFSIQPAQAIDSAQESVAMVADALGFTADEITETIEPKVASNAYRPNISQ
jgi:hypothetical protein